VARDSAHVEAWGSAHVVARDSAHVEAWGSAHVVARDSAHVVARDSAHVEASNYVSVHKQSPNTTITGGVVIEVPPITTIEAWCEYYGTAIVDGTTTIYKALNDAYMSSHDFSYCPGTVPVAPDWDGGDRECGGGLHGCAHPLDALWFQSDATRFVAMPVRLVDIVVHHPATYPSKIKFKQACGPVMEVDRYGTRLEMMPA
jgi:hypothetical protein